MSPFIRHFAAKYPPRATAPHPRRPTTPQDTYFFRRMVQQMEPQFDDRILLCSDCHAEFVFTAGEQLFFYDKQFKNDPKRCKPCKSRRSGLSAAANGAGPASAGLSRTETRTECSECGVQTTVPFKPTQGRAGALPAVLPGEVESERGAGLGGAAPGDEHDRFADPLPR